MSDQSAPSFGALYLTAQASFSALAQSLSPEEWATPVPCLPGWDVRDVLSHVAGIPDDALAGRMDGVAGEAWTASQVARNRQFTVEELLHQWAAQTPGFAEALDLVKERRPPFDCHSHEHDVRHALHRPGARDSVVVEVAGASLATFFDHPFGVTIELADGRSFHTPGSGDTSGGGSPGVEDGAVILRGMTMFELFRSRLGRRSRDQVRGYDWVGDDDRIEEVVAGWFTFGPADNPIVE